MDFFTNHFEIRKQFREFFWGSALLILALPVALASTEARNGGYFFLAAVLSVFALLMTGIAAYNLVPKLVRRVITLHWDPLRYFKVTNRGIFFIFLLLLISIATFNTGNNLLIIILSLQMGALLVSGTVSNLVLSGLKVRLQLPEAIHAGNESLLLATLKNQKKIFPSFGLELKNLSGDMDKEVSIEFSEKGIHFPFIRRGEEKTVKFECVFNRRGVFSMQGFRVNTTFPFGLFSRGKELHAEGRVKVYPKLMELRAFQYRFPFFFGQEALNKKGSGDELQNLRDYHHGDDTRFVHWKASAKLGRLIVKEFSQSRDLMFQVVFSTQLRNPSESELKQFEKAVSLVTSLVNAYFQKGQEISFYSGEYSITIPAGSRAQYFLLMDYLAEVHPSPSNLIDPLKISPRSIIFSAGAEIPNADNTRFVDYLKL